MSPTTHLNALLPRVRYVESADGPDNSIRNIVLAIIFSIAGAIGITVGVYLGCLYWRKHKRSQQRRSMQHAEAQQVMMKNENQGPVNY